MPSKMWYDMAEYNVLADGFCSHTIGPTTRSTPGSLATSTDCAASCEGSPRAPGSDRCVDLGFVGFVGDVFTASANCYADGGKGDHYDRDIAGHQCIRLTIKRRRGCGSYSKDRDDVVLVDCGCGRV